MRRRSKRPAIAVALHDVAPATFERCALIRDWLDDHGIDRITLVLRDADGGAPDDDTRAEPNAWLDERARDGDIVAEDAADGGLTSCSASVRCPPAAGPGVRAALRRAAAPWLLRTTAALCGDLLRLDLHPVAFERPQDVAALEAVLRRAGRRRAVTHDDLTAAERAEAA